MKPDLNHLAAEIVMGWRLEEMQPADDPVMVWVSDKPGHEMLEGEWNPLTDANQCFMLVERMKQLGWWLYWDNEDNEAIFCSNLGGGMVSAKDPDPRLAIIKAAMAAMATKEDK